MGLKLVQLTDLHLFRDESASHSGVATWVTFRAVCERLAERHGDFDYLVLTGDLAQDEEAETYRRLREALGPWAERCRLIPGNHDDRAGLRAAFPELLPAEGPLTFSLAAGGWQVLGLDSQDTGEVEGRIDAAQLAWLQGELEQGGGAPAVVFLHHPPVPVGVDWLDRIGLQEPRSLLALIERFPQVRAVCSGHVHREHAGRIGTADFFTTPSTCVQFGAGPEVGFDPLPAGYRTFILDGDRLETAVHRLDAATA